MPVYVVVGKLGTGKTKFAVWMAQQALRQHRKVASNVDIKAEILHPYGKRSITRIPDKPSPFDLAAMGHGNPDKYNEDRNGVLILDELGTWLNARSWQEEGRAYLLDWLIHARKHGWDVYMIVQDANMIDRQVRDALIEYEARCMRMDKVRIPFLGHFLGLIRERWAYWPKFHMVTARLGYDQKVVAERWRFLGHDLHAAYDTLQVFASDYPHGPYCTLPPWDWVPRLLPWQAFLAKVLPRPRPSLKRPPIRPKTPLMVHLQRLPPERRIAFMRRFPDAC